MYGPPIPDYATLPEFVRRHGWPEGFEQFAQTRNEAEIVAADISMRQTGWKGLLSWRERESAVVCDAACGTAAIALAPHFERVYAVYSNPDLTDVVRARLDYCGVRNVAVSAAVPDLQFDAAVLYGLPAAQTIAHLETVRPRLRPHATAYVAFRAQRASALAEVVRPEFQQVMAAARGVFPQVRPYWYMGSITGGCELRTIDDRQTNWRHRLGGAVVPWFGAYFGLEAGAPQAGPPLVEDILTSASALLSRGELTVERYIFAHPSGLTLIVAEIGTGHRMIIRVPFGSHSERMAANNAQTLVRLATSKAAPAATPRFLCSGSVHGQPFYVESAVEGSPAPRLTAATYSRVVNAAADFLIGLHRATMRPVVFENAAIAEFIEPVADAGFANLCGQHGDGVLRDLHELILHSFRGRTLNVVATHGDFSYDNLLFDTAGRVSGAFDWDLSSPAGLPLMDLAYLFATTVRRYDPRHGHGFLAGLLQQFNAVEQPVLRRYCEALNIPGDLVFPLFVLSWLHQAGIRLHSSETYQIHPYYWTDTLTRLPAMIRLHEASAA